MGNASIFLIKGLSPKFTSVPFVPKHLICAMAVCENLRETRGICLLLPLLTKLLDHFGDYIWLDIPH